MLFREIGIYLFFQFENHRLVRELRIFQTDIFGAV